MKQTTNEPTMKYNQITADFQETAITTANRNKTNLRLVLDALAMNDIDELNDLINFGQVVPM